MSDKKTDPIQIIERDGKPEWAVLPYKVYLRWQQDVEMLQDIRDYDEVKNEIDQGQELVPSEVLYAILDGESPIKIWREHRGFTQQELASKANISASYLSQLETGKRSGTTEVLIALASLLKLNLDDIVVAPSQGDENCAA